MIQKADAGRYFKRPRTVEIYLNEYFGFLGLSLYRCCPHRAAIAERSVLARRSARAGRAITRLISGAGRLSLSAMNDDATDSLIPYDDVVQEALRAVVGRVLRQIAESGLPGEHHFYITFKTQAQDVSIPDHLMERFPDEMTIVLQHKYWDLIVEDNHFEVGLSFGQIPSHLVIPYAAITAFVDPAVDFALQFHVDSEDGDTAELHETAENDVDTDAVSQAQEDGSNVVNVDFGSKK